MSGVPISTRDINDTDMGNHFATMFVALPVQIEDPLERLHLIHKNTMSAKEMTKALRARHIQALAELAPPAVINSRSGPCSLRTSTRRFPRPSTS